MYKDEINRFNKLIDEKHIYLASKATLKDLVEEFFSRDYKGISKKQMEKVKLDFEIRFSMTVISRAMKSERYEIDNLHDQIKTSLEVILDKSVGESRLVNGGIIEKIGESLMLQPNINGIGVDLKKLFK